MSTTLAKLYHVDYNELNYFYWLKYSMHQSDQQLQSTEDRCLELLTLLKKGNAQSVPKDVFVQVYKGCSLPAKKELFGFFLQRGVLTAQQSGVLLTLASQESIESAKQAIVDCQQRNLLTPDEELFFQNVASGEIPLQSLEALEKLFKEVSTIKKQILIASLDILLDQKPLWSLEKKQRLFYLAGEDAIIQLVLSKDEHTTPIQVLPEKRETIDLFDAGKSILTSSLPELLQCTNETLLAGEELVHVSIVNPREFASYPFTQAEMHSIADKLLQVTEKRDDYVAKRFLKGLSLQSKKDALEESVKKVFSE